MKNRLHHQDSLNTGAEKINQSTHSHQQPEGMSQKEQLEHDAHQERGTEKARKQLEHIETKESIQQELESVKSYTPVDNHQDTINNTAIKTKNTNPHIPTYPSADAGRAAAQQKVIHDTARMQSFFGRTKAA